MSKPDDGGAARDFEVLRVGLVSVQVCSSLPLAEITRKINESHPTGLDHGWSLDTERAVCGNDPNPNQCAQHKENKHYVFTC